MGYTKIWNKTVILVENLSTELILITNPDTSHMWLIPYRNADRLTKSDTVSFGKKRLHLKNVSAKDNGVYRCVAHNEAGTRNSADNFSLAVAGEFIS
jgi:hypothetical protein